MQIPHSPNPYLPAFLIGTGAKSDSGPLGMALAVATYFVPFGSTGALIDTVHVQWDATAVGTITVEDSCNPDVLVWSNANGEWLQENPTTAYVPVQGGTVTNLTISITGGTAGGAMIHVGSNAALRKRLRVVLTTGGRLNFTGNGKT